MKKIFAIIALAICIQNVNAQFSIRSGFGFSFSPPTDTYYDLADNAGVNIGVGKFTRLAQGLNGFFEGQYHFSEKVAYNKRGKQVSGLKKYDFGVSAPTMLGIGGIFIGGGNNISYFYSTGLVGNYNMGSFAYNSQDKNFGIRVGLGIGVQNTSNLQIAEEVDVTGLVAPNPKTYTIDDK